ncbi:MAG: DNA polymerase III subunit delta [Candidatus Kapaibacteriales bacterium]
MVYNFDDFQVLKDKSNLFFLFGEEDFLVYQAYRKILNTLISELSPSIEIYDADEIKNEPNILDKLENIFSSGLFAQPKIIVFKNIEKLFGNKSKKNDKQFIENVFRKLVRNLESRIFIIFISFDSVVNEISSKLKSIKNESEKIKVISDVKFPFNFLLENAVSFEFPKVYESQHRSFLKKFFVEAGFTIDDLAIDFVIEHTDPNLWFLFSEFEKIITFCKNKPNISLLDVQQTITQNKTNSVFDFISAVANANLTKSIEIIQQLLLISRQEVLITSQLLKYFRNLLVISDLWKTNKSREFLAKEISVNPYFLNDYLIGLKNYTKPKIHFAINQLVSIDYALKSTTSKPLHLLTELLTKIMSPN